MFQSENLQEKWSPILEHNDLPEIGDNYKKAVTAVILENQEKASSTPPQRQKRAPRVSGFAANFACVLSGFGGVEVAFSHIFSGFSHAGHQFFLTTNTSRGTEQRIETVF